MWSAIRIKFTQPEVPVRYHTHTPAYAYNIKCHTYARTVVHVSAKHVRRYERMYDFPLYAYVGVSE